MKDSRLIVLGFAALLAVGCGGDDPVATGGSSSVTVADLVGSWTASSHAYTDNSDGAVSFDLIANGGETRTTVLAGGGARTWVEFGTFSDEWDAQLSISGSTLTSTPQESTRPTRTFAFTLSGTTLTLTDSNSQFDFTLMGGEEVAATEVIVFVKQ